MNSDSMTDRLSDSRQSAQAVTQTSAELGKYEVKHRINLTNDFYKTEMKLKKN